MGIDRTRTASEPRSPRANGGASSAVGGLPYCNTTRHHPTIQFDRRERGIEYSRHNAKCKTDRVARSFRDSTRGAFRASRPYNAPFSAPHKSHSTYAQRRCNNLGSDNTAFNYAASTIQGPRQLTGPCGSTTSTDLSTKGDTECADAAGRYHPVKVDSTQNTSSPMRQLVSPHAPSRLRHNRLEIPRYTIFRADRLAAIYPAPDRSCFVRVRGSRFQNAMRQPSASVRSIPA